MIRIRYFVAIGDNTSSTACSAASRSRYTAYATARQWGWMSANNIRRMENMNPIEGGEDYMVPLNMVEAGRTLNEP